MVYRIFCGNNYSQAISIVTSKCSDYIYSALVVSNWLITMTCRLLALHAIFRNWCSISAERDQYPQWSSLVRKQRTSKRLKPNGVSRSLIICSIDFLGSHPFSDTPKYLYHIVGYILISSQCFLLTCTNFLGKIPILPGSFHFSQFKSWFLWPRHAHLDRDAKCLFRQRQRHGRLARRWMLELKWRL